MSTLDVFPTVMALTGAKPPLELDGVNLTPYLKGEKKEPSHDALFFAMDGNGAVRQNQWKLVRTADGISHLFDLEKDVEEKTDLAGPEAERVKDLQAKWQAWNAQMPIAVKKSITEKASITDHINDLIND